MSNGTDAHDPSARCAGTSPREAWGGRSNLDQMIISCSAAAAAGKEKADAAKLAILNGSLAIF